MNVTSGLQVHAYETAQLTVVHPFMLSVWIGHFTHDGLSMAPGAHALGVVRETPLCRVAVDL